MDEENIPVIPETNEDVVVDSSNQYPDIVIVEDDNEDEYAPVIQSGEQSEPAREPLLVGSAGSSSPLMSSAVQLNGSSNLTSDDPVTMMDSILNDNINLLGK